MLTRRFIEFAWVLVATAGIAWINPLSGADVRVGVGFQRLGSERTGVAFTNQCSPPAIAANRVLANGGGVAVGDADGDGRPDLFFCGIESSSRIFQNLGDLRFRDVTREWGLPGDLRGIRGSAWADLNGDRIPELILTTVTNGVRLLGRMTNGVYRDITADWGVSMPGGASSVAIADVDGDGFLDLYVANYRVSDIRDRGRLTVPMSGGKPVIPAELKDRLVFRDGQLFEYGEVDRLWMNTGRGRFREESWTGGGFLDEDGRPLTEAPRDWGLSAIFRDLNDDGAPDLYVCNDFWTPDRLWFNEGTGKFRLAGPGVVRHFSGSSMGVDAADLDRDGRMDLVVVDMLHPDWTARRRQAPAERPFLPVPGLVSDQPQFLRNTLFRQRDDGSFSEIALFAGLEASDWSWCPIFMDVDLDGYEDLLITAGHFRDVQDMDAERMIQARQRRGRPAGSESDRQAQFTRDLEQNHRIYPERVAPIHAFRNAGGFRFDAAEKDWGLSSLAVRHGMATGDFDGDGDLDLAVNVLNGECEIYRNVSETPRLAIRLEGAGANANGIGARVSLEGGSVTRQTSEMLAGGRYLSGSEPLVVMAMGTNVHKRQVEVRWRSGKVSRVDVEPGRTSLVIQESTATAAQVPSLVATMPPLFVDASERLAVAGIHSVLESGEFARQPLLPYRVGCLGPPLVVCDADGDGDDDVLVSMNPVRGPEILRNDGTGHFGKRDLEQTGFTNGDPAALLMLAGASRTDPVTLWQAASGYDGAAVPALQFGVLSGARAKWSHIPGDTIPTGGAMAMGYPAGLGEPHLFVAGGVLPGRYPIPGASRMLVRQGGEWRLDTRSSALFAGLGLIRGVVWSDLDADGRSELVLAEEWGPIRIFALRGGTWWETTKEWQLSESNGLWQGIASGDFDGDGRMDLVAANWGWNSEWKSTPEQPLQWWYGETQQPGRVDVLEAVWDVARSMQVPARSLMELGESLPYLYQYVSSHADFVARSLAETLGERRGLTKPILARSLASTVFLNREGRFESRPLPKEAQWSPAWGICVADFDGDQREDLFLTQNSQLMRPGVARLDAGRGLVLLGEGNGDFRVLERQSGVIELGDQRSLAIGDFNRDGRPDVAMGVIGRGLRMFLNSAGRPGVRVILEGGPENVWGIGAQIRTRSSDRLGPVREVQLGSGLRSQSSPQQILQISDAGGSVVVRWPGGKTTETKLGAGLREIRIPVR